MLRRGVIRIAVGSALLAGCTSAGSAPKLNGGATSVGAETATLLKVDPSCDASAQTEALLAVTSAGDVVAINPSTLQTTRIAVGVSTGGGVAVRPELDVAYVTAPGPDGQPAIWGVPIASCRPHPVLVETDAELPSVSPDGGYLGFVTLDASARQSGVAVVSLGASGTPVGVVRRYPATSIPPPLPISGIAVGDDDTNLAVWGGFVDPYLGKAHVTVGTMDPATARSLGVLAAVFDEQGISIVTALPNHEKPEAWQSTPVYLPSGELLIESDGGEIMMPFENPPPTSGGGIRNVVSTAGSTRSLAAGPGGSLAWVSAQGRLVVAPDAVNLPFGPAAQTPPSTSPPTLLFVKGNFISVAWTPGISTQSTTPTTVFHVVDHLPSVVGLSEARAASVMAGLDLPVFVAHTTADPSVPSDTVLAQDPAAGFGTACQCAVSLTVSTT